MLVLADRGEIDIAYCDEAGFTPTYPNRSAWTPVEECHTSDALRGKRPNVVSVSLSSGELFTVKLWETMTALLFTGFLGLLMEQVGKPLVVILDNASVHMAKAIQLLLKVLQRQGLKLHFLPPYSQSTEVKSSSLVCQAWMRLHMKFWTWLLSIRHLALRIATEQRERLFQ